MTPHLDRIVRISLSYVCHDPNYNYGDEDGDDDEAMDDGMEDEDGEEESDDEVGTNMPSTYSLVSSKSISKFQYSDDDDMAWKVRRSGAKCLEAVIATRHELLSDFYAQVGVMSAATDVCRSWFLLICLGLPRPHRPLQGEGGERQGGHLPRLRGAAQADKANSFG